VARRLRSGRNAVRDSGAPKAEINNALADSAVRESFLQSAQEPLDGTAAQFARVVHDDYDRWGGSITIRVSYSIHSVSKRLSQTIIWFARSLRFSTWRGFGLSSPPIIPALVGHRLIRS
jgi:hypothetical protein